MVLSALLEFRFYTNLFICLLAVDAELPVDLRQEVVHGGGVDEFDIDTCIVEFVIGGKSVGLIRNHVVLA